VNHPEYGWQGRVGLIVPPANVILEPELASILQPGISLHVTRLPGQVSNDTSIGLRERFIGYNAGLALAATSFGGADLSAVCLGVTGSCYMVGPRGEDKLLADLRAGNAPTAMTASRAIRQLIEALRRRRIGLVAPYPDWVTALAAAYWRECGFDVVQVVSLPDVVSIYEIDTPKVVKAASGLKGSNADVVLLSGTGVPTLSAIRQLSEILPMPVISSNLSLGWWINRALGGPGLSGTKEPVLQLLDGWIRQAA
jgi:maleate isomerase